MLFVMMRIDSLLCFYGFTRYGNEPAMTQIKNEAYFYKVILHLVDHGHNIILGGIQIPLALRSQEKRFTNIRW